MVAPGSLEARYQRLAGDEDRRRELYAARVHLRFSVDEWLALPWWQRRLYVEGMVDAAEQQSAASGDRGGGSDLASAILGGTLDDVRAVTGGSAE